MSSWGWEPCSKSPSFQARPYLDASEIWFDCMGQAHILARADRFDHARSGLVWYKVYKVYKVRYISLFLYEAGPTRLEFIPSIATADRARQDDWILPLFAPSSPQRDTKVPPQNGSLFRNNGREKAKAQDPPFVQEQVVRRSLLENSSNRLAHLVAASWVVTGVQATGKTNPPWQAGRRRPNRWERLGVAENGLEI